MYNMTEKDILKLTYDEIQNLMNNTIDCYERINHCQAWFNDALYLNKRVCFIKSYNTVVALYCYDNQKLYSVGKFSMTTYQHIRKYKNNYTPNKHNTKEINLELCNWFK